MKRVRASFRRGAASLGGWLEAWVWRLMARAEMLEKVMSGEGSGIPLVLPVLHAEQAQVKK